MTDRLSERDLVDIQGFVTSGYGHLPLARYVLLQVADAARAQTWLGQLAGMVTTAAPWPETPGGKVKPVCAYNVAFTATGLAALGLPATVRCTFPIEFLEGMATPARSKLLGDRDGSAPEHWSFGGPASPPLHIVVLVHAVDEGALEQACGRLAELVRASDGGLVELPDGVQHGHRPPADREPFGFNDGIAQPKIRGIDGSGVPTGEFILGYANHYDVIAPTAVVPEALAGSAMLPRFQNPYHADQGLRDLGRNGTFVVYRKLEQDVAGFWDFMKHEALRTTGREDAARMVWLAARCMGRWPSGAPLAVTPGRDRPDLGGHDDFLYDDDPHGFACPFAAHVRRVHPRAVIPPYGRRESLSMSEAHRLLRRGRVYGPPRLDPAVLGAPGSPEHARTLLELRDDGAARGIHFLCVNASIGSQFEFVQQTWCNNPRFAGLDASRDPVIGDHRSEPDTASRMALAHRPLAYRSGALSRFVTVRGGAYLFMPSLTALRFLAEFRS